MTTLATRGGAGLSAGAGWAAPVTRIVSVMQDLPVVDIGPLVRGTEGREAVARQIDLACREVGFFYVVEHGVPRELRTRLESLSRSFFALAETDKAAIAMPRGGRAWRGWFPVGGELTSGLADHKEGVYFGRELGADDPRVVAGTPLHGPNLFPAEPTELRQVVLAYIEAMTDLGHMLVGGLGLALGLGEDWFDCHLTADPLVLFRIFHYPPAPEAADRAAGVGEHTDYGLLTILGQDSSSGLEVHTTSGWVDAPPLADSFVCNLGDMLERMTGGRYQSTPHRVRAGPTSRLSFPFFFDPSWDAVVQPIPVSVPATDVDVHPRWDGEDVHDFDGTYGDYLTAKVARVFPALGGAHLT